MNHLIAAQPSLSHRTSTRLFFTHQICRPKCRGTHKHFTWCSEQRSSLWPVRGLTTHERRLEEVVPFRKQLKDEAQRRKADLRNTTNHGRPGHGDRLKRWELVVGIEIHAELNTAKKLFSLAATSAGNEPNSHVAIFDAAFPGSQPNFQRETLLPALRAAIALNCKIQRKSTFDRKHYFYQDQPAGYQITQYYGEFPVCS